MREFQGHLNAKKLRFRIVVSRFNEFFTSRLLEGALDALRRHGADEKDLEVVWVPGSFEIPAMAKKLANPQKTDAVICLGAVVRGDTPHFDLVSAEAAKGVAAVGLQASIPVIFGVITTDSLEQAVDRAGAKAGNKGAEAAIAAIEMADLHRTLDSN